MRERFWKTLKKYAIVLGAGAVYVLVVMMTDFRIVCAFYRLTGLQCPACGVSRMMISLLHLDFQAAFRHNPYLLLNAPVILLCLGYSEIQYVQSGHRKHGAWWHAILWCELGLALLFGVLRNLPI